MADSDSEDEKLDFVGTTKGGSPRIEETDDEEEADDIEEVDVAIDEIRYLIKGSDAPKTVGPLSYDEFKRHYNDPNIRCDKLTRIWNGLEIVEPTPLWQLDRIFMDIDPEKYAELERIRHNRGSGQTADGDSGIPLAQPMSIEEMKAKEDEEQRLKSSQEAPILEEDAKYSSYASGSCCIVL